MTIELVRRRARRQARVRRQQLLAERRATDPRRLDRGTGRLATRLPDDAAGGPGGVSGGAGRAGSAG